MYDMMCIEMGGDSLLRARPELGSCIRKSTSLRREFTTVMTVVAVVVVIERARCGVMCTGFWYWEQIAIDSKTRRRAGSCVGTLLNIVNNIN